MAINKKLIHFNKKATFNSQKLSANDSNTQYQVGGTGTVQTGAPDINYQSIVYIKDSKEIWTHGQFYGASESGSGKNYYPGIGDGFGTTSSDVFSAFGSEEKYIAFRNDPSGYDGIRFGDIVYEFAGKDTQFVSNSHVEYGDITTLCFYKGVQGSSNNSGEYPGFEFVNIWDELHNTDTAGPTVYTYSAVLPGRWYSLDRSPDNCIVTKKPLADYIASQIPSGPPVATPSVLGGIKVGYTTSDSDKNYKVQLDSSDNAYVNVPWTDTTYTLPAATSSVLGGVKIGNGLNINSGVLSVTAPQVDNHTVYNLVGYKSGINPLKNTPQLTFKSSEISGSKSGTLTIGDDPESGPSWVGALNLEYSERSNLASVYTESPLSITSSLGDLGIYASDAGGGGKLTLSTASSIHLINSNDNFATVQLEPRSDSNGYSYLNFICGPSANAGSTVLELGGADDQAIFSGSVSANGGFFDTSDARVKTNVRELNAINADAIKLVEFDRTDTEHHGYGVIAQEVEEVYPSVVNTDANGFKSVNYNEIAMIKIKYLEDKVARLEALVARLESKLS